MRKLSSFRPTDNQLKVLAVIAANKDKPEVAAKQLIGSENLVGARNLLMNMNIITYSDSEATLTDLGNTLAVDSGIIDDSGNLTDLGNTLASSDNPNAQNQIDDNPMDLDMNNEPGGEEDLMSNLESFSPLFKTLIL